MQAVVTSTEPTPRVLHIGPPYIRIVPLQSYMKPDRCPVLLRPLCFDRKCGGGSGGSSVSGGGGGGRSELDAFVARLETFAGAEYSVSGASQLLMQTLVKRHTSFQVRQATNHAAACAHRPTHHFSLFLGCFVGMPIIDIYVAAWYVCC